jgi:hypothetical protein
MQLQAALCCAYSVIFVTIFKIKQIIYSLRVTHPPPPPQRENSMCASGAGDTNVTLC